MLEVILVLLCMHVQVPNGGHMNIINLLRLSLCWKDQFVNNIHGLL